MGVVQDPKVQAIIDRELVKYLSHEPRERTRLAFRSLQERRQGPEPLDINLAAAEHYLFARFLAGRTGDPLVRFAPTLYGIKKRAYFALGIGQRMVAATGIRILSTVDFRTNRYNLYIVALSIGFGLIPLVAPRWMQQMAHGLHPLLESGILLTSFAAVVLNLYFNGLGSADTREAVSASKVAEAH